MSKDHDYDNALGVTISVAAERAGEIKRLTNLLADVIEGHEAERKSHLAEIERLRAEVEKLRQSQEANQ